MKKLAQPIFLTAIISLAFATAAAAQNLTGSVTNGTTNKTVAGDEVTLINLANGMDVAGSTKADSAGKFSFTLKEAAGPHLVRVAHQGVTYFQVAPPGTNKVGVTVYDVSQKIEGLSLTADVLRIQADKTSLDGMRLFVVENNSSPAVTQMNDHNFEFYLPVGAKVEQVQAKAPNGQPIPAEAVPQADKGHYAIAFPLRPGETQIQLEFTLPYSGSLKFDPKLFYPASHFVVVLPKTMQFSAADSASFKSMQDPNQSESIVQVAQQTKVGQKLAFTVSGTGTISEQPAQASGGGGGAEPQGGAQSGSQSGPMNENPQTESNRPGGGLGVPIDAPDPLEKYRWPIIGAFVLLLALGGWVVTRRQGAVSAAARAHEASLGVGGVAGALTGTPSSRGAVAAGPLGVPITGPGASAMSNSGAGASSRAAEAQGSGAAASAQGHNFAGQATKSSAILEALKEEMFQLELERKQGKVTPAEYESAKAALDQTLDRALKRQS